MKKQQPVAVKKTKVKHRKALNQFDAHMGKPMVASQGVPVLHLPQPSRMSTPFSVPLTALGGSAGFKATEYIINPGYAAVFARVADIAKAFIFWRFKSLTIQWTPIGSSFSDVNKTGQVSLAWKVDPTLPRADSMASANVAPVLMGDAWEVFQMVVPTKYLRTGGYKDGWRYTTVNDFSTANCPLDEAIAVIEVCIEGSGTTSNSGRPVIIGEVEYDIPSVQPNLTPLKQNLMNVFHTGTAQVLTSGVNTDVLGIGGAGLPSAMLTGVSWVENPLRMSLGTGTFKIEVSGKLTFTTATAIALNVYNEPTTLYNVNDGYVNNASQGFGCSFYFQTYVCIANGAGPSLGIQVNINVTGTGTITLTAFTMAVTNLY